MSAITSPNDLKDWQITTLSFEDIANLDGKVFTVPAGPDFNPQPYGSIGVYFGGAVVRANANLASTSSGVAIQCIYINSIGVLNWLPIYFATPQRAVGFFYRDRLAKSIQLLASDVSFNTVEEVDFPGGEGYAGVIRPQADIASISVYGIHGDIQSAFDSPLFIDDLSFSRHRTLDLTQRETPGRQIVVEPGGVAIIIGQLPADGPGIVINPFGGAPPFRRFAQLYPVVLQVYFKKTAGVSQAFAW